MAERARRREGQGHSPETYEERPDRSHRQLQAITDALPTLVAFIGDDERYEFVNASYERWFGHPKSEMVGRTVEEVLGPGAYLAIKPHLRRALNGERVSYEAEIPYRDGGVRWIEANYLPQRDANQTVLGIVSLVADISERKQFERFRARAGNRAERLLEATEAIANAVSDQEVYEALVDGVAASVDASSSGLWLIREEDNVAELVRSKGYSDRARATCLRLPLSLSPSLPVLDCIRLKAPLWIPSQAALLDRYPHLSSTVNDELTYRISCLPLIEGGFVLGALAFTIEETSREQDEEREFLLLVSRYATQAIARLRLLNAEKRSSDRARAAAARLEILNRASRAFGESNLSLPERLREIVSELSRSLDSCISLSLAEADGLVYPAAVQHPIAEAQAQLASLTLLPRKVGEGAAGLIAATGESLLIPMIDPVEASTRAPENYRAFLEAYPIYALMGTAVRLRGRAIGAVIAMRCRPGDTFTQDDLKLLDELAERAAAAIENSRLYEESVAARKRAEQLYLFAASVASAERVEDVFEAAITAIGAALGTHRAAVLTYDDDQVMRFRASRGLSEGYRQATEGHSPWLPDSQNPEPIVVMNASSNPAMTSFRALFESEGIGALAFIPLISRGRLLGKFMVYYDRPHQFGEGEIHTAQALANHIASVTARFQAIAKLEETIRYNELFAGVLAHDLRNPLGAMMTAAQILLMRREGEKALGEQEARPLSRIVSSGERMNTMIKQLLDFTQARSGGGLPIAPHETNLGDLCAQAVDELELGNPAWTIEREAKGDLRGTWDSDRLLQLFSNLVANACQHGVAGVPVRVKLDGTNRNHVRIEVQNQGSIPETLLPHVFDPFRSLQHRKDRTRGLGLGLFIVREITRGHGGSVDVAALNSESVAFIVQLPRHCPLPARPSRVYSASQK